MLRAVFLLVVCSAAAVAAPVPKPTEADKLKMLFGTPVDPDKDCRIQLDGTKLIIRAPETPHMFAPDLGGVNAPRVGRMVAGDFVAQVRIRLPAPKLTDPAPGVRRGPCYAGMYLALDDANFVYHARTLEDNGGKFTRAGKHGGYANGRSGSGGGSGGGAFDPETVYFRITRAGAKIKFAASADGTGWHEFGGPDITYPDKATLGLYLANAGDAPCSVEFDQFTVTPTPLPAK